MTAPATARVAAIDVGGTSMKASIIDAEGASGPLRRRVTPVADGPDAVVRAVLGFVDDLVASDRGIAAVGLVVPGVVDEASGVAVNSENIGWRDIPFRALLHDSLDLPVGFGHDVRAAGVLERAWGAAAGPADALYAPIGTGVSATIWHGGRLLEGPFVGELGHIDIGTGLRCACGATGCVETIATAAAIVRRYRERTGTEMHGAAEVIALAAQGDADAAAVWDEAVDGLVDALTVYVTLLAPERIVIGGGLSEAGDTLLVPLRGRLLDRLIWQRRPEVVRGAFGGAAGRYGAALAAFDAAGIPARFTTTGDEHLV